MFPYKNPITISQSSFTNSVARNVVFGNNFSVLNTGGYMELWSTDELGLTLTASTYPSQIQLSANTIPINFTKGTGSSFSPDSISLNSDNISSGRRRLGMLVYVQETGFVYQFTIDNYETLWNNLSGLTGNSAITQSDYSTVVNNRSVQGQNFINAWTGSTIEGINGVTRENARWRIFNTSGLTCNDLSGCTIIQNIEQDIIDIQDNYVPYIGATQDVDLGYNTFINNNGLLTTWNNEFSEGETKVGYIFEPFGVKQLFFRDVDKTNNFQYSAQTTEMLCNIEEGWGTTTLGYDYNDGTVYGSTVFNTIGGAGLNTRMGNNNVSQITTSAGEVALTNLNDGAGPLMESSIRLWKDYTNLYITNLDTTESNTIELYTDRTYTKKYITTDEGYVGDYLQLNTASAETSAVGKLKWNDTDGTADLGLKGGNVTLQIGEENVVRVVNKTGSNLLQSNYQVVRIRTQAEGGAAGQRLAIKLAQADTKANHSAILGLVTENINNNQEGFITTFGNVNKINTTGSLQGQTWNDGDDLWLSESVAGGLTNIEPTVHPVRIGYVIYAHSNNGKIYVSLDNGVDVLDELHDVKISAATNGDVLTYNSSTQLWENKNTEFISRQTQRVVYTDFMSSSTSAGVQFPYAITLVNTGAVNSSILTNGVNPGINRFRSSATPNSGVYLIPIGTVIGTGTYYYQPNTQVDYIFRTPATIVGTGIIVRFGMTQTSSSTADFEYGTYIEINENSLYGKTADNSVRSQTSTTYTLSTDTWYHGRVKYVSSSLIEYSLYNMNGVLLWSDTLTTNIPSSTRINPIILALSSGSAAIDLIVNDYFSTTYPVSNRGALN